MCSFGKTSQLVFRSSHGSGNLQRVAADPFGMSRRVVVAKIDCRTECTQCVFIALLELLESFTQLAGAVSDHFFEMQAVIFNLLFQMPFVKGPLEAGNDSALQKRLDEIIVRAGAHGLNTHLDVVHTGGDQKSHVRIAAANLGKKFQAADTRHLEVGNDGVKAIALQNPEGFLAGSGSRAGKERWPQHYGEESASGPFIVDGKYADDGRKTICGSCGAAFDFSRKRFVDDGHGGSAPR